MAEVIGATDWPPAQPSFHLPPTHGSPCPSPFPPIPPPPLPGFLPVDGPIRFSFTFPPLSPPPPPSLPRPHRLIIYPSFMPPYFLFTSSSVLSSPALRSSNCPHVPVAFLVHRFCLQPSFAAQSSAALVSSFASVRCTRLSAPRSRLGSTGKLTVISCAGDNTVRVWSCAAGEDLGAWTLRQTIPLGNRCVPPPPLSPPLPPPNSGDGFSSLPLPPALYLLSSRHLRAAYTGAEILLAHPIRFPPPLSTISAWASLPQPSPVQKTCSLKHHSVNLSGSVSSSPLQACPLCRRIAFAFRGWRHRLAGTCPRSGQEHQLDARSPRGGFRGVEKA